MQVEHVTNFELEDFNYIVQANFEFSNKVVFYPIIDESFLKEFINDRLTNVVAIFTIKKTPQVIAALRREKFNFLIPSIQR